jgi:hypothetical protein
MEVTDQVRKAVPDDLPEVSTALSRAFYADPLFGWGIPDDDRRQRLLPEFFALFTRAFLRHDQTYTTRDGVVGPRCGRRPERCRSPARMPRSWAGGSRSWQDPTRHAFLRSANWPTTTTPTGRTGICSSWGSRPTGRAGASVLP